MPRLLLTAALLGVLALPGLAHAQADETACDPVLEDCDGPDPVQTMRRVAAVDADRCVGCFAGALTSTAFAAGYDILSALALGTGGTHDFQTLPRWVHAVGFASGSLSVGLGVAHGVVNDQRDGLERWALSIAGGLVGAPAAVLGLWGLVTDTPPPPQGAALVCGPDGCQPGIPALSVSLPDEDETRVELSLLSGTL